MTKIFDQKTQILIRAAVLGIVIGIVAVAFRKGTESLNNFLYKDYYSREHWYDWLYMPLVCSCGGLIAGFITSKFAPDASGSGITQVKKALNLKATSIKLQTVIVKFFGAIISIASGLSLGREGPTIQIGAGIGEKISKLLGGKHRKRAIASGAGAGLAAAFNTPIAGVIFVIEELDKNLSSTSLGPAIVGSVTAAVTCRMLYGDFFTLHFRSDYGTNLSQMPLFILLGIICACIGVFFQKSILWILDIYPKYLPQFPIWSWGAFAGLITGIVGLFLPQALGGGHSTLEGILSSAFSLQLILLIFVAKFALTVIAYGSRVPGGIFAPSLILGALLGYSIGSLSTYLNLDINPANFAFVGMGAFFTAISRAPITSIVMLFELTGNYQLILPLMFACILANVSAEKLQEGSIYKNLLTKEGVNLKDYSSPTYLQSFLVEDAMSSKVDSVQEDLSIEDLQKLFKNQKHSGYPVLDKNGNLVGAITKSDLVDNLNTDINYPIKSIMCKEPKTVLSSENLHSAIVKLYEFKIGRLFVIADNHSQQLVGILTRSDIINFEASQEIDY